MSPNALKTQDVDRWNPPGPETEYNSAFKRQYYSRTGRSPILWVVRGGEQQPPRMLVESSRWGCCAPLGGLLEWVGCLGRWVVAVGARL